ARRGAGSLENRVLAFFEELASRPAWHGAVPYLSSQGGSTVTLSSNRVGPPALNAASRAAGNASTLARRSPRAPNARARAGKSGLARSASPQRWKISSCSHLIAP